VKQLSCKRKQKWWTRSSQQINSPVGDCSNHARTNNSFLPLIGLVQLQMALAKRCRKFDAVEVALQQSTGKNGVARFGVNQGPLKGINLPSPRSQVRELELEQQRVEAGSEHRQYGHEYPAAAPNRFYADEQTSVVLGMHTSQWVAEPWRAGQGEGDRFDSPATEPEPGCDHRQAEAVPQGHTAGLLALFPVAHTSGNVPAPSLHQNNSQNCDALVSPSQNLIGRYRASGIDHPHFLMLENGLPATFDESKREGYFQSYSAELNRFGYFKKLNRYKGVLVLLQAMALLQDQGVTNFIVNINGANLEHQPKDFQDEFNALFGKVKDRVILRGSYRQQDIAALMLENDWVVMPSIWWENSPGVVQESFSTDGQSSAAKSEEQKRRLALEAA
jgi:hypothetical protein